MFYFFPAEGFSIYIKNLPMNVTPPQIEVVFKSFGPIKRNGIQVRSHKVLPTILFLNILFFFGFLI